MPETSKGMAGVGYGRPSAKSGNSVWPPKSSAITLHAETLVLASVHAVGVTVQQYVDR